MNLLKSLVLIALFSPMMSWAAINLPEPADLMEKAAQSRTSLRDIILDLEFNIPEMRDPATFDKYFATLDRLQVLSVETGLEEYFPNIVKTLGLNMVSNGMRWLDVTKDSSTKLGYYIKWMDADSLARFLGLIEFQMSVVKDSSRLMALSQNLEAVLPLVDEKASTLPYVQLGFRRLVSDAAVALLKTESLSEAQVAVWLQKIKISSSFSEYLDYLNQGIYSLDRNNKGAAHIYLSRLSLLLIQASNMSEVAPNWLLNGIGDSLSEVILRMVRLEETFKGAEFSTALNSLKTRHLQGLAQQWMAQEKLPSDVYVDHYLALSRELIAKLQAVGLKKEADELAKWLSRVAAPVMAQKLDLEGHYKLTNDKGEVFFLTIAVAKENTLIAAMSDSKLMVERTFFNVSYNLKDDGFVASQREPDTDSDMNPPVKFTIDSKGQITLVDLFVRTGPRTLKGTKVQSFTDLWKTAKLSAPSADGTYVGSIFLPNGTEMKVKVIITTFNGYSMGRLESEGGMDIDLTIGSQATDGVVILTSGRNVGASWFQLRANVTEEGLNAYVIVGGRGQGTACTFLKRIDNK
ncbi:hypothetical protein [Bdellovibrio sp.]|uniref:hypothetical protein n=1 Tax=Bdellovibrio TaxID=958 RepID=UPI003221C72D